MTFAEKLAEKPAGELLKIMSNIHRGSLTEQRKWSRVTPDDPSAYADYFSEIFAANSAEREAVALYVILSEKY